MTRQPLQEVSGRFWRCPECGFTVNREKWAHGCIWGDHPPPRPRLEPVEVVPRAVAEQLATALQGWCPGSKALAEFRAAYPKPCTQLESGVCDAGCPTCDPDDGR